MKKVFLLVAALMTVQVHAESPIKFNAEDFRMIMDNERASLECDRVEAIAGAVAQDPNNPGIKDLMALSRKLSTFRHDLTTQAVILGKRHSDNPQYASLASRQYCVQRMAKVVDLMMTTVE